MTIIISGTRTAMSTRRTIWRLFISTVSTSWWCCFGWLIFI